MAVLLEMSDCDDVADHQQGHRDGVPYVVGVDGDRKEDGLGALRPLHCIYLVDLPHPSDAHLDLRTASDGFTRKSRKAAESTTPPGHSHTKAETGMNLDVVAYGEDDEESTCVAFLYPADAFLELVRVRLLSESEAGFGEGDAGGEKLVRVRLLSESEARFRDGGAGEELVPPPIIADEEDDVPVPAEFSWIHALGWPMSQTVPDTCALIAATVCLEARHRRVFEEEHGRGTFPCRAAAPRKLRAACFRDVYLDTFTGKHRRIWTRGQGANTGRVLTKLKQIGGARTTNAPPPAPFFLPLENWTCYGYDDFLTHQMAARLIFEQGPCIGSLFSVPGCRRQDREMLMKNDPDRFGMHALVCFAYRYTKITTGKKLEIEVLDNNSPIGTTRWVDFEEFDRFYVVFVNPLPPRHLLGRSPPLVYPFSLSCHPDTCWAALLPWLLLALSGVM